jgi:hypothetical protein
LLHRGEYSEAHSAHSAHGAHSAQSETVSTCLNQLRELDSKIRIEHFFQIYNSIEFSPCQHFTCDSHSEVNVILHAWLYCDTLDPHSAQDTVNAVNAVDITEQHSRLASCGIFKHSNAMRECHQFIKDVHARGISFGRMESRSVALHSAALSPNNNQFHRETLQYDRHSNSDPNDWLPFALVAYDPLSHRGCTQLALRIVFVDFLQFACVISL